MMREELMRWACTVFAWAVFVLIGIDDLRGHR
jgi:hypothetical protein